MIADDEIRDAKTLGICARLAARGFISLEKADRFYYWRLVPFSYSDC